MPFLGRLTTTVLMHICMGLVLKDTEKDLDDGF